MLSTVSGTSFCGLTWYPGVYVRHDFCPDCFRCTVAVAAAKARRDVSTTQGANGPGAHQNTFLRAFWRDSMDDNPYWLGGADGLLHADTTPGNTKFLTACGKVIKWNVWIGLPRCFRCVVAVAAKEARRQELSP